MPGPAPVELRRPEGRFALQRYPARNRDPLQAWCSADILLLDAAQESGIAGGDTLVVNDEHGALATVLRPRASWTDSALSARALADNLARNNLPPVPVYWSTVSPGSGYRLVLLRIPKQLAYFEYQLACLHAFLPPGSLLICSGMDKHLSPHTAALIERYFGSVQRHRGTRKARLFTARRGGSPAAAPPPRDSYFCAQLDAELVTGANVFSREGLDMGARFLLAQLPRLAPAARGADLACGNGVLGLTALRSGLCRTMTFADESAMAIAAARDNALTLRLPATDLQFLHGDGLLDTTERYDLVLCNPPFHQGHTVDDFAGKRLIRQAVDALAPGGVVCLVANRHLPYREILQRCLESVEELACDHRFRVWLARSGC